MRLFVWPGMVMEDRAKAKAGAVTVAAAASRQPYSKSKQLYRAPILPDLVLFLRMFFLLRRQFGTPPSLVRIRGRLRQSVATAMVDQKQRVRSRIM